MTRQGRLIDQLLLAKAEGRHPVFASSSAPVGRERQKELQKAGLFALEYRHDLSESTNEPNVWSGCLDEFPILFTCRSVEQGGKDARPVEELQRLLSEAARMFHGVDIELAMGDGAVAKTVASVKEAGSTAIVSWHDHSGTTDWKQLKEVLDRCNSFNADAVKIAVQCDAPDKLGLLVEFLSKHSKERLAVLGMGRYGAISRALLPHLGSLFTFASIGESTASGQMALEETVKLIARFGV